jgi:hypothetical protein
VLVSRPGVLRPVMLAIDGTKVTADASCSANRTVDQLEDESAKPAKINAWQARRVCAAGV